MMCVSVLSACVILRAALGKVGKIQRKVCMQCTTRSLVRLHWTRYY